MPPPSFRVLAMCAVFEPGFRGGGVVRGVVPTVDTVPEGIDLALVTRDRDLGAREPYSALSGRWVTRNRARVFYLNTRSPEQWRRLLRDLRGVAPFDLLYVNSTWAPIFTLIPVIASRLGMIRADHILLAPHGEFSPGALGLKAQKKQVFLRAWGPFLRSANVLWHAHTEREADEIRDVLPWARIAISPYQVMLPSDPLPATTAPAWPTRLVFIGRICPKKNVDLVLRALRQLSTPVTLDVYGPVEDAEYWSQCRSLISSLPGCVEVGYKGELKPAEVRSTFARYDAFVFPTLGENFGYVIAESLSASCPVICSAETPWTSLLRSGGGVVLPELTAGRLATELRHLTATSPAERLRARRRAGEVYRSWRAGIDDGNVLELVRRTLKG